jgi:hypothetical protein
MCQKLPAYWRGLLFTEAHRRRATRIDSAHSPVPSIRRGDGGPQKPFSSFSEGVRGVFTISTESSERACVPHFSSSVTPHVLVVGGAGKYSLETSSHNVWKTIVL